MTGAGPSYLIAGRGLMSWLNTRDHKRIGVMFLIAVSLSLFLGGVLALLLRLELLTPEHTLIGAEAYNRTFTMHGVVMVWMFLIPSIPAGFGNFVLPIMLGAKDVAFPKLNLASFYVYCAGSALVLYGLVAGGLDTGWTFYTPYSTQTLSAVAPVAAGIFVLGISSIITGVNFIVTTHTMRARGLSWRRLPLFVWAIYATSIIQVLATPVLGMTLLLVAMDNLWAMGLFDPSLGGDPVLFQHLFWFYSHPAVYIMILPAFGVVSEVVTTYAHNRPASYWAIALSSLGIAFVGFFTWGHHMFVAGMSNFASGVFGALSMFVAVFSAIKVFTWTATLFRGRIDVTAPMLYFFGFMFLFVFGGMSGVAVATSSLDIHWHDTYFVVAHFHFIMVGGSMTMFLAALFYWFPKMFGRMYNETWGMVSALAVFGGFVFTFTPQFLLGNGGLVRRSWSYPEHHQWLNVMSTAGASVLAMGLVLALLTLLVALFTGTPAGPNPWGSRGYEWSVPSPPPVHNFETTPVIGRGPYDYHRSEELDGG